ncbi:thioredoxin domain-containing protein [Streptomyces sp. TRM66268-LWL]|uniref:Thioredoxin domain-containing protein n=1 Tax=Streptomyces polyasparticus TaxID=2767826 RepID=A0ABR7SWI4_9ACTN|nr:thioredoxin domain-containing protein [Streptomyces polyasparticus]MBC9718628.1 thioredoxin domain-containing protein [Streptomyces polyasparticus]
MSGSKKEQRAARERLRAEREAAARKAKVRGRILVAGAIVSSLALAGGVAWYVTQPTADAAASEGPLVTPAHTSEDGLVVPYGKADSKHVLTVWVDPRCPYCAGAEVGLGKTMKQQADEGKYRIEYHFATFLDGSLGGKGSKRAVNALGAAANESPEKFMEYLGVLYANHPEKETDDKFGSTATLLELADQVEGLRTPAFNKAVKELTYMPWVEKVSQQFYEQNINGTPTVLIDGKKIRVNSGKGIESISPERFTELVDEYIK